MQVPWAHFVAAGLKPIENRRQRWAYRGPILVHVSAGIGSLEKFNAACLRIEDILGAESQAWCVFRDALLRVRPGGGPCFAPRDEMPRGGIVARARIVDCIEPGDTTTRAAAKVLGAGYPTADGLRWWFEDQYGYVLADVERLPLTPWKAGLGLRKAPPDLLERLGIAREAA
jgi:hypothetical protein